MTAHKKRIKLFSKRKPKKVKVKLSEIKKMTPEGLYFVQDGKESFKSRDDIQTEQLYKGAVSVNYPDRYIAELSYDDLQDEMIRRSQLRNKVERKEYETNIELKTDHDIGLLWFADVHSAAYQTDYERLKWEIDEVRQNPYLFAALGGDFAQSFCWNPAQFEDVANLNEQHLYLYRTLEYLGWDKILFAVVGNHEKWARRMGLDMYRDMRNKIPVFDGIGTVNLYVNKIKYVGGVMHKPLGSSPNDPNWGSKRFTRENEGYDFVMSAHKHLGGEQSFYRQTDTGMRKVVGIAGKTFKSTDEFHDDNSIKKIQDIGIGTNGIVFSHDKKMMRPQSCMYEMLETLGRG